MISTGDLKRGMTLDMDGDLWSVLEFHHIKMGRGSAQVRLKIRNVKTGTTVERSFQAGEKFRRAIVDRKPVQYLYHEDETYYFMDTETYEQTLMNGSQLADVIPYLKDQLNLEIMTHGDEPLGAELPPNVDLQVTRSDPGLRGDTASGATKPATLETGLTIQVPLFVNEGDVIRVDTRTGQYLERV
jgi:elongation factor P